MAASQSLASDSVSRAPAPPEAADSAAPAGGRRDFILRRLHSLTGLLPVGAFLLFHLFENLKALQGAQAYDRTVRDVVNLAPAPWFYLIEFGVVLVPILFHGLLGFYYIGQGRSNVLAYPYRRNWMYWMQRISGVVAFAFIVFHFVQWRLKSLATGQLTTYAEVSGDLAHPLVMAWYLVGTVSIAWHFGMGLYGFCWTWGIAVGARARRFVERLGWATFLLLSAVSVHIIVHLYQVGR